MKLVIAILFFVISLLVACKSSFQAISDNDILFTYDGEPVTVDEFEYVYGKNNIRNEKVNGREDVKEYLDLFIDFKLKVREARARGYDTTEVFKKEFETYKNQLIRPYLSETRAIDILCQEAYKRMKWEVKAAHILIRLPKNPLPSDTLKAYEKISKIHQFALDGEDFGMLARKYSEDPSAATNGGMLGYFTVFQMVYPFENAVYRTKPREISDIIRTEFGYHILKVLDKRPTRGKVKVAHILIRVNPDKSNEQGAQDKIFEIYDQLKAGGDWDVLCGQFSEDNRTRHKGGSLPYLSTGQIDNTFADMAFSLEKPGDISDPFQTRYGWHILKLEGKKGLDPYENMKQEIESKVRRDTRGLSTKKTLIKKLKAESHFKEDKTALEYAVSRANDQLVQGQWTFSDKQESLRDTLFSFDGGYAGMEVFFKWVKANQKPVREVKPDAYMTALYNQFVEKTLMQNEVDKLIESNMEFKMLLNEYYEGMLLFEIMDREVWSRSSTDTSGLRAYYEDHKDLFMRGESVEAEIYSTNDETILKKIRMSELDKDHYEIGKIEIVKFSRLPDGFVALMQKMQKVKDGHIILSGNKLNKVGLMDSISYYLIKNGIDPKNISMKYTEEHPQTVLLSVNSKSKKSLELLYNTKSTLTLQVDQGKYEKGDNPLIDTLAWQPGVYETDRDGRYFLVRISRLVPPEQKSFDEARGKVITLYQEELERNWIKALKSKYIVEINHQVLNKVYRDLENMAGIDH